MTEAFPHVWPSHEEMVERNRAAIRDIPEALALVTPPRDRITRLHKTLPEFAEEIMTNGYNFSGMIPTMPDLRHTTSALIRPGIEVGEWPEEDIRQYNLDALAAVHRGADSVVVISIPDPVQGEGLPREPGGINIVDDGGGRAEAYDRLYDQYLDLCL